MWSSSSTVGGILSGPSDLVGLRVLGLLNTAAEVMSASGIHTPSELLAQLSDGILSSVSFSKKEEKNKCNCCDFCLSVSEVLPSPKFSLPMPFFTSNDVFMYFPKKL